MERNLGRNCKRPLEEDDGDTRPDKVVVSVLNFTASFYVLRLYYDEFSFTGGSFK